MKGKFNPDEEAHKDMMDTVVGGLRRKRLMHALRGKPKEKKGPEDLGGYDKLQEMFDEKK
jgi:hypothetical protein